MTELSRDLLNTVVSKDGVIADLRKAGACDKAIEWLSSEQRTLGDAIEHHPDWVIWAVYNNALTPDLAQHADDILWAASGRAPEPAPQSAPDMLSHMSPDAFIDFLVDALDVSGGGEQ